MNWAGQYAADDGYTPPTVRQIMAEVAAKYRLRPRDLMTGRRDKVTPKARQEAYWRCRDETLLSYPAIGKAFKKEWTTVRAGIKAHEKRMGQNGAA